jgi:Zn-dependent protease with chaperone function
VRPILSDPLYPPSPTEVPPDLTRPSARYKFQVVLLLISLLLFLLFYLALVAGSVWMIYWGVTHRFTNQQGGSNPLINIGLVLAGAMLVLFLLKALVNQHRPDPKRYVEVTEEDQPELFRFINRLCEEVKADRPSKVYLSFEVNAAVFYDTSMKALLVPPPKNLLIGLGLVNSVPLSEFKATLAHEFGHFSQRSIRLGIYVYMANHILHDIIYARDSWDLWLIRWCRLDPRLSFPAWGLRALIWLLRNILGSVFRLLNRVNLALRRQMEFNADDVAVSVSGSDPITHVLCRLKFASDAMTATGEDLFIAADNGIFTRDLFYHQTAASERIRRIQRNPNLGQPPALGSPESIFEKSVEGEEVSAMWMSHPSNEAREANAKRHYLPVVLDDRSSWLLFTEVDNLKKRLTEKFYLYELGREGKLNVRPPEEVQSFIDLEHAETTFDPTYHDLYESRLIQPGQLEGLTQLAPWTAERTTQFLANWPPSDLGARMAAIRKLQAEQQQLLNLQKGRLFRSFTFRDELYVAANLSNLLKQVDRELKVERAKLHELDRDVFLVHFRAAQELGLAPELEERYRFQLELQKLLRTLLEDEARLSELLNYLVKQTEQQASVFRKIVETFIEITDSLDGCLQKAGKLSVPPLSNVPAGTALRDLLGEPSLQIPTLQPDATQIPADWIVSIVKVQAGVLGRLRRVHFKSLGNILKLQELIALRWKESLRRREEDSLPSI